MSDELPDAIRQFADRHLSPYRVKAYSGELVPRLCPFCGGGDHGDQETFALNMESGLYVCKRGSCGAKGRLRT